MQKVEFSKPELVTIAVALLDGDTAYVDCEDVALKVNDIAPGRFNWRKYPAHIDLSTVSFALQDAKNLGTAMNFQKRRKASVED